MPKRVDKVRILELRMSGLSVNEIARDMRISKGTVSLAVRGVPLQRQRLSSSNGMTLETKGKIGRGVSLWRRNNSEAAMRFSNAWKMGANISFTKHELSIRPRIEFIYGPVKKELIGGSWADFANEKVIIEVTQDCGKGITDAIKRFEKRNLDDRKKILCCYNKYFGPGRRSRASAAGVEIVELSLIEI